MKRYKNTILFLMSMGLYSVFFSACSDGESVLPNTTTTNNKYSHIPQEIDNVTAIRFLNKATFGATSSDIQSLQALGVESWLDKQLAIPLKDKQYLTKMINLAKLAEPSIHMYTLEEYLTADNDIIFNKESASFRSPIFRTSAWFDIALSSQDQVRQKMTYALSQIIVESDFEPIFKRRAEALATYFDILQRNAFGNYGDLLTEISLSAGMGMFLTYQGNKKQYINDSNVTVYPDENYARELMQLFSIGLSELNIDGSKVKDSKGNEVPTYTQNDVNELSRVFTGWDLKDNPTYGKSGFKRGDYTQPLEFTEMYHDREEKIFLDANIESGLSGENDIKRAIEILMQNKNIAPYISKHLIMRLVKSNPSPNYISRVASIFKSTGGDLKVVVKAILLDEELWNDLENKTVIKFKEPLIAYTSFLRAFHVTPLPSIYFCPSGKIDTNTYNCEKIENKFWFTNTEDFLNQGAGDAPTVFNFYDNAYIPNDDNFKSLGIVAPEIQIQSDAILINFSNAINNQLESLEINYLLSDYYSDANIHYDSLNDLITDTGKNQDRKFYATSKLKLLLDTSDELDVMEMVIDGDIDGDFKKLEDYKITEYTNDEKAVDALVSFLDNKLTGGLLSEEEKEIIASNLKTRIFQVSRIVDSNNSHYSKKHQLLKNVVFPAIRAIVTSNKYMTE